MVASGAVRTYRCSLTAAGRSVRFTCGAISSAWSPTATRVFGRDNRRIKDRFIKRTALMARAENDKEVSRRLWMMTGDELKRVQAHVLLLIKTAKERVAEFLPEMARRGSADEAFDLPMSRQDIADYLGLTIETVSRTLTDLEKRDDLLAEFTPRGAAQP